MEMEIVEFNRKKQQAETDKINEMQRARAEKEIELQKLRDMQLKAATN